jgi:hypothetical protein
MRSIGFLITLICLGLLIHRWIKCRATWRQDLGFGSHPYKVLDLVAGFCMGFLAMFFIFGIEWACDWLRPGPFVKAGLFNLNILPPLAFMALWEELRFRGIEISGFRTLMPPWAALVLSSLLFGLAHAWNANATALSIAGNIVGGLVYGYAFLVSGAIWLPTGLHAAWNMAQGPILGLPISGYLEGGLWNPVVSGPQVFTGGAYGPEAGIIGLWSRLLILALLWVYLRLRNSSSLSETSQNHERLDITCLLR